MERCVFERGKKCSALVSRDCAKCTMRKTHEELIEGREKAMERIKNLPQDQYDAIMKKYHGLRRCTETEVEEC